jgi:hypothetical protein
MERIKVDLCEGTQQQAHSFMTAMQAKACSEGKTVESVMEDVLATVLDNTDIHFPDIIAAVLGNVEVYMEDDLEEDDEEGDWDDDEWDDYWDEDEDEDWDEDDNGMWEGDK